MKIATWPGLLETITHYWIELLATVWLQTEQRLLFSNWIIPHYHNVLVADVLRACVPHWYLFLYFTSCLDRCHKSIRINMDNCEKNKTLGIIYYLLWRVISAFGKSIWNIFEGCTDNSASSMSLQIPLIFFSNLIWIVETLETIVR